LDKGEGGGMNWAMGVDWAMEEEFFIYLGKWDAAGGVGVLWTMIMLRNFVHPVSWPVKVTVKSSVKYENTDALVTPTRHTSHITRQAVTSHRSHVTGHLCCTSRVTRHLSHTTRHIPLVTSHSSHVTRHTSHSTRHVTTTSYRGG